MLHVICGDLTTLVSMQNLHELDDRVLMDMLAEHTQKLTSSFKHFAENDAVYNECKQLVLAIATELATRKKGKSVDSTIVPNGQSATTQDEQK
jgi:hypothetical protein